MRFRFVQSAKSPEKVGPSLERLLGPDPEARDGADDEEHEILDHVDGEVGLWNISFWPSRWTGNLPLSLVIWVSAQPFLPLNHLGREVVLLVEQASNDDEHGDNIEDREHANPDNQLL